jgi:hypothetical protein
MAKEMGVAPSPVKNLSIQEVLHHADIDGPDEELAEEVRKLHLRANSL